MPEQEEASKYAVTVLGNGIVGLAVAYALIEDGHTVTVIDRGAVDDGTSTGNAGAIAVAEMIPIAEPGLWKRIPAMLVDPVGPLYLRATHVPFLLPWFFRFMQACRPQNHKRGIAALAGLLGGSMEAHLAMLQRIGAGDMLNRDGTLFIYRSEQAYRNEAHHWQARRDHGIDAVPLDREDIAAREPALGPEARFGYFSSDWAHYRDPRELVVALAEHLRARGVRFEQAEITDVKLSNGGVSALIADDGRAFPVARLIVAAGAWSGRLSKRIGDPYPIEADRGYNTTLPDPGVDIRTMVTFSEDNFVMTPMSVGLRIGGSVEMGGLDAPPNYQRSRALIQLAKRYIPDLNVTGGTEWMGHRPGSPDSVPVISASPHAANVHYAFGHGHLGLSMSVITGRIIADMIAGRDPGLDMSPYRIDRFR
ncbi:FAD-binding oxidoreductase [Thalassospiraceae bacterium LMO-JJ14]|nr:FAD-binding oxidoreductase [Thalassospiraceae bacterium LMO-JJ14]